MRNKPNWMTRATYMQHPTSILTRMYWRSCIAQDQANAFKEKRQKAMPGWGTAHVWWLVAERRAQRGWWRAFVVEARRAL